MPHNSIPVSANPAATIPNICQLMLAAISPNPAPGAAMSDSPSRHEETRPANSPEIILSLTNGRRMNPFVAPTSCIVCMVKRRAYMARCTVLLIKTNDIITSTRAIAPNTMERRSMLRSCSLP